MVYSEVTDSIIQSKPLLRLLLRRGFISIVISALKRTISFLTTTLLNNPNPLKAIQTPHYNWLLGLLVVPVFGSTVSVTFSARTSVDSGCSYICFPLSRWNLLFLIFHQLISFDCFVLLLIFLALVLSSATNVHVPVNFKFHPLRSHSLRNFSDTSYETNVHVPFW